MAFVDELERIGALLEAGEISVEEAAELLVENSALTLKSDGRRWFENGRWRTAREGYSSFRDRMSREERLRIFGK